MQYRGIARFYMVLYGISCYYRNRAVLHGIECLRGISMYSLQIRYYCTVEWEIGEELGLPCYQVLYDKVTSDGYAYSCCLDKRGTDTMVLDCIKVLDTYNMINRKNCKCCPMSLLIIYS